MSVAQGTPDKVPSIHGWGVLDRGSASAIECDLALHQLVREHPALTEADILGPSEAFRQQMDYFSHTRHAAAILDKLVKLDGKKLRKYDLEADKGVPEYYVVYFSASW